MLAEVQGMDLHARSPFMRRILRECLFPLLVPYSDIFQTFCVGQSLKCDVLKPRLLQISCRIIPSDFSMSTSSVFVL